FHVTGVQTSALPISRAIGYFIHLAPPSNALMDLPLCRQGNHHPHAAAARRLDLESAAEHRDPFLDAPETELAALLVHQRGTGVEDRKSAVQEKRSRT